MLKLLFVEDEPDVVEPIQHLIHRTQRSSEFEIKITEFQDAESEIVSFSPDVVILDLLVRGASAEPENQGQHTLDFIWNTHFCPVVVYATEPAMCSDEYRKHPFVATVKKGSRSPHALLKELDAFRPQIDALKMAEGLVRRSFAEAMREVAPYAFEAFSDAARRTQTITRSGRRRLAALMDEAATDGAPLESWEQYLFPPVRDDIQLGDVLREKTKSGDDPTSFRVVLTPSCDLVQGATRRPKVTEVLVSKCCSIRTGLDRAGLKGVASAKLKNTVLPSGYFGAFIPFPRLKDKIPPMVADLRDLQLIDFKEIGPEKRFVRVASVDSPFRELVSWAYLQTACRPGLPDRNMESWGEEIMQDVKQ